MRGESGWGGRTGSVLGGAARQPGAVVALAAVTVASVVFAMAAGLAGLGATGVGGVAPALEAFTIDRGRIADIAFELTDSRRRTVTLLGARTLPLPGRVQADVVHVGLVPGSSVGGGDVGWPPRSLPGTIRPLPGSVTSARYQVVWLALDETRPGVFALAGLNVAYRVAGAEHSVRIGGPTLVCVAVAQLTCDRAYAAAGG